jgi:hypothetical protein
LPAKPHAAGLGGLQAGTGPLCALARRALRRCAG